MKTFYSILSLNIRPEINERLSIGMLLISKAEQITNYAISHNVKPLFD